jgi:hypothetical protein
MTLIDYYSLPVDSQRELMADFDHNVLHKEEIDDFEAWLAFKQVPTKIKCDLCGSEFDFSVHKDCPICDGSNVCGIKPSPGQRVSVDFDWKELKLKTN